MKEAKRLITEGRLMKTEGAECEHMEEAFEIVTDLLEQMRPLKYIFQGAAWILVTFVAGLLSALAAIWLK